MVQRQTKITANVLRELPDAEVQHILKELGPKKAAELQHDWGFWARPEQLEPEGSWNTWVALAGRGWGKTRAGAEWVRHRIRSGDKIVHCVAPTKGDVRRVMVEGDFKAAELFLRSKGGWSPTSTVNEAELTEDPDTDETAIDSLMTLLGKANGSTTDEDNS